MFLDILTPLLYMLNCFFSVFYYVFKFFQSFFTYKLKSVDETNKFDTIYLFFFNFFPDRCRSADLFEESKYYIILPSISTDFINIPGKVIINYKSYLNIRDSFVIIYKCLYCLSEYILKDHSLCLVHKAWEFYELEVALKKIANNSSLVFCNQSDKWALLFDNIPSKSKILLQHGLAPNWGKTPYRLGNIDIFYSMTKSTWKDAFNTILDCEPQLLFMKPTIELYDVPSQRFNILIVADIVQLETEKEILEILSRYSNIDIYLKKHPSLVNDGCYKELKSKYNFVYITEKKFPNVDFVISYYSTLAYEYMAYDIPVYMYMDHNGFDSKKMIGELEDAMRRYV